MADPGTVIEIGNLVEESSAAVAGTWVASSKRPSCVRQVSEESWTRPRGMSDSNSKSYCRVDLEYLSEEDAQGP